MTKLAILISVSALCCAARTTVVFQPESLTGGPFPSNALTVADSTQKTGIHVNLPGVVPAAIVKALASGDPAPSDLSEDENHAFEQLKLSFSKRRAYAQIMGTRPQTLRKAH